MNLIENWHIWYVCIAKARSLLRFKAFQGLLPQLKLEAINANFFFFLDVGKAEDSR